MITLATHIETEKKQSSVKKDSVGSCWTRRDVFLDMLDQRGIPFTSLVYYSAYFVSNPCLLHTALKLLNPCYNCDQEFNPNASYFSNKSLAEKSGPIGSVIVNSCSVSTIVRHKLQLAQDGIFSLIERHDYKPSHKTIGTYGLAKSRSINAPQTTVHVPSEFFAHFNSAADFHQMIRQANDLFPEFVSRVLSYEHSQQISIDDLSKNKLCEQGGDYRVTNTLFSLSKDKGTYEGSIFLRAKRKKNGELRKPRSSRLLITPARQKTMCSPARQSSLCSSSGKLGIAGRSNLAFEGRNEVNPVCSGEVDPGISNQPTHKSPETPCVGQNRINMGEATAGEKQASEGPLKTPIQKQKTTRVVSRQETRPLKLSQMPDARAKIGKKAYDWAAGIRISEGGALVRLQRFGKQQQLAIDGGKLSAKDAFTTDVVDYWLTKVNPIQLMYILDESSAFIKKNKVYSRVRFLEYRICSAIKNITAYEQRKNFNKSEVTTGFDQGQK